MTRGHLGCSVTTREID